MANHQLRDKDSGSQVEQGQQFPAAGRSATLPLALVTRRPHRHLSARACAGECVRTNVMNAQTHDRSIDGFLIVLSNARCDDEHAMRAVLLVDLPCLSDAPANLCVARRAQHSARHLRIEAKHQTFNK
jgi:hypothetical protein